MLSNVADMTGVLGATAKDEPPVTPGLAALKMVDHFQSSPITV
jgi:hypothetical protein